ncbi:SCO1 protein [Gloeophyllum trabeum ATCC 11539]|uniref:SCO1 protein n=1 Tax=Gloeophyllum trabeum (strain ATCC 11539 / FP-39264 / Madison 617) TaxID=670483 RepID=S7S1W2_GLOTA|nr:SCO1 protein [Gloeophyllum trabeum ATCC 11539]EPQ59759.1 SCO1 protein [Gloeophyllum trabeum ATCC 11539]
MRPPFPLSAVRQRALATAKPQCLRRVSSALRLARHPQARTTSPRRYVSHQTSSGERDRAAVGVFTPKAAILFVLSGVGLFWYFRHEKAKLLEQREKELESRQYGRAHVGGPFSLSTHKGEPFTEKDLLGKWSLIYFGFTNCPDICPAELDKMSTIYPGAVIQPIFISVDPARDSPAQIAKYLTDFHPRFVGLTGPYDAVKAACKAYRVYFSTPPGTKPGDDYLVDHSIFIYLMDPAGQFVDAFGQVTGVEDVVARFEKEVGEWEKEKGRKV